MLRRFTVIFIIFNLVLRPIIVVTLLILRRDLDEGSINIFKNREIKKKKMVNDFENPDFEENGKGNYKGFDEIENFII